MNETPKIMSHNFNEEEVEEFKDVFALFDKNGDG